jgi:hypothetical protein
MKINVNSRRLRYAAIALCALAMAAIAHANPRDIQCPTGCEWRNPGADKYVGTTDAAIDRLQAIPASARAALKAKLNLSAAAKLRAAEAHVLLTHHHIASPDGRKWMAQDMNGGNGQIAWGPMTRATWSKDQMERALVFCAEGYCVAWYSVCRNVSRITPIDPATPTAPSTPAAPPTEPAPPARWDTTAKLSDAPLVPMLDAPEVPMLSSDVPVVVALPVYNPPSPVLPVLPDLPMMPASAGMVAPIPEPSTYALMGLGLLAVGWVARRSRSLHPRAWRRG